MNIKWSKVNFIAAIVGARVSMGLFSNITSPTLPTLAQNCNFSIATVSWIFTVRSVASFIGAAGVHSGRFRYIFRNFPQRTIFWSKKAFKIINPTLILSLSLALAAVCLSCIPLGRFSFGVHYDKLIFLKTNLGHRFLAVMPIDFDTRSCPRNRYRRIAISYIEPLGSW